MLEILSFPIVRTLIILFLGIIMLSQFGLVKNAIIRVLTWPSTGILKAVVLIATLPAAFSMAQAEQQLREVDPGNHAEIEQIRMKMAASVKSSWSKAHNDADAAHYAHRFARSLARA